MRIYYYTDQPLDISKYTKEEIEKMLKEEEKRTKNYNSNFAHGKHPVCLDKSA